MPLLCHRKNQSTVTTMKRTGIFYGSSTGITEGIAHTIAQKLGVDSNDVHDAARLSAGMLDNYDALILGSSTWGCGELQDDWYDAVKVLCSADLGQKTVALFGCGDAESYPDTFCDAMGLLYEELKKTGCRFTGNHVATDDYSFTSSVAVVDGDFVGLALDETNESDKSDSRIEAWVKNLDL